MDVTKHERISIDQLALVVARVLCLFTPLRSRVLLDNKQEVTMLHSLLSSVAYTLLAIFDRQVDNLVKAASILLPLKQLS